MGCVTRTMAERSALEQVDEQLTCNVCLEQFTNPKYLLCMHSFCLKCIEGLQQELKVHIYTHIFVPIKRRKTCKQWCMCCLHYVILFV